MKTLIILIIPILFSANPIYGQVSKRPKPRYITYAPKEPTASTWLQWPHHYQYGKEYRLKIEPTWVTFTKILATQENVHVIAHSKRERRRIERLLEEHSVNLKNVDFHMYRTDNFWIRDNGPMFVNDINGNLYILDWGFNGWGNKGDFEKCDEIPSQIGKELNLPVVDLNSRMILEGGSIELDHNGTLMACESSVLNSNRNPRITKEDVEHILATYIGVNHFIWLEGQARLDITGQRIDGFARFLNPRTIVTMKREDLLEYKVLESDIDTLYGAKNGQGEPYNFVTLPLTRYNVRTTMGRDLGYRGSYCGFYVSEKKVIIPFYNDRNDQVASHILKGLYPNREIIGVDFRNVYTLGGSAHCIALQQPKEKN